VSIEVISTLRAQQQIAALDRMHSRAIGGFLDDLARNGCAALAYRLTGPTPLDRLCVKHLRGTLRVVVGFETPRRACILLVGRHDDIDPSRDVYGELYALLDATPPNGTGRAKPPCCGEDGSPPPGLGDAIADLIIRSAKRRSSRRRAT
jgi:hypothetical protein